MSACDECLRRAWLIASLADHLERARRRGGVLALDDGQLIEALGGSQRAALTRRHASFSADRARRAVAAAGLVSRCGHGMVFPRRLLELPDPPAALFIAGRAAAFDVLDAPDDDAPAVAVVGARRCAGEGMEVAGALGRGLAAADVCVVSGLALGIDGAAHQGALAARRSAPERRAGPTVAVLAGGADFIYPASARALYASILEVGCAVSELPPGVQPRKWSFPARNRIIAALSGMTVVVQARERSGSLITADLAMQLGRPVGAVPGPVTRGLSAGTNALLHDGAHLIRDARDVLDVLLPGRRSADHVTLDLEPELDRALATVADGATTAGEIAAVQGWPVALAATAVTRLELLGLVRRDHAGRYAPAAPTGRALL